MNSIENIQEIFSRIFIELNVFFFNFCFTLRINFKASDLVCAGRSIFCPHLQTIVEQIHTSALTVVSGFYYFTMWKGVRQCLRFYQMERISSGNVSTPNMFRFSLLQSIQLFMDFCSRLTHCYI